MFIFRKEMMHEAHVILRKGFTMECSDMKRFVLKMSC